MAATFPGLELLATAVLLLNEQRRVQYANPAAENLLGAGAKSLLDQPFVPLFEPDPALETALSDALVTHWDYSAQTVAYLRPGRESLLLSCILTRTDSPGLPLLAELRPIEQQLRQAREERLAS
jgi:two-component system nitrogen regulation sensor histidine kinase GlnL